MKQPLKLNLGSGKNKLEGFVNIDIEPSCKPDRVLNFIQGLPYKKNSVDEIVLFHTIEHINKCWHYKMLCEFWRVLKAGGRLMVSYPEFLKCVKNWRINYRGKKDFWEATIFGRQAYSSDFHVCIMHTPDFVKFLSDSGFTDITVEAEPFPNQFNTIVGCAKGVQVPNYEELMTSYMNKIKQIETPVAA